MDFLNFSVTYTSGLPCNKKKKINSDVSREVHMLISDEILKLLIKKRTKIDIFRIKIEKLKKILKNRTSTFEQANSMNKKRRKTI